MSEEEIKAVCQKYDIKNYTINTDMSIDVDDDVSLFLCNLKTLPVKFGKVAGNFSCVINKLVTLDGCPNYVAGHFSCSNNKLTTLQHLPINFYIGDDFGCESNSISSPTEVSRLFFGYIGGKIETGCNNLDEFLNKNKNPPKKDLPKLLSELRKIKLDYEGSF